MDQAFVYLSEGNGTGLVRAHEQMNRSDNVWSYTYNHSTYSEGAKIYVAVLAVTSGVETCVPQGTLSNVTSWASFDYGSSSETVIVNFDSNGADIPALPSLIEVIVGTTIKTFPTAPVKTGYTFTGWNTARDGTGTQFSANVPVNDNITLYAQWILDQVVQVYFDSNGADSSAVPAYMQVISGSALGSLPSTPSRNGYYFTGWNTARDGTGIKFTANIPVYDNITVYAQWSNKETPTLLPLANGMHMTMQFINRTGGEWDDSQIYITILARNEAQQWCWVKPNGTLQPMSLADNGALVKNGRQCANYSFKLSDIEGFQLPSYVSSGRAFVTIGEPLYITVNIDGNGQVAYAAPDLNNSTDPNNDVYFDWYEFSVAPASWEPGVPTGFWGNTTQVDQLSIPLLARVYEKGQNGEAILIGENGIAESRASLWSAWVNEVPSEFRALLGNYRINAPCKDPDGFGLNAPHSNYFDAYVNQIWDLYRTKDLVFNMFWNGQYYEYHGRVQGDAFVFSRPGRENFIAVARKPNVTEIFEASGVLATGNTEEGAIQARIAAAFNRHVMEDTSKWTDSSSFYRVAPCNYYAKFMHDHSVNGKAYGFAYDDVGDFSGLIWSYNARAVVIDVNW